MTAHRTLDARNGWSKGFDPFNWHNLVFDPFNLSLPLSNPVARKMNARRHATGELRITTLISR